MRQYRRLLQRCLGGALRGSAALLASPSAHRRRADASSSASGTAKGDGDARSPPEGQAYDANGSHGGSKGGSPPGRRRTPAQLLADLGSGRSASAKGSAPTAEVSSAATAHLHHAMPIPAKSRTKGRDNVLLTPPTRSATRLRPSSSGGSGGGGGEDDAVDLPPVSSSPLLNAQTPPPPQPQQLLQQQPLLTNPFRGLHTEVSRSFRIDPLLQEATPCDLMIARQEKKSAVFSFLHFRAGERFYKGHWGSELEMQQQLNTLVGEAAAAVPTRRSGSLTLPMSYGKGTPIPGVTLFNNDIGLHSPLVQCSYPLIVAQRLLLFPDHLRHFHAICGREEVPCDFFADIDLPEATPAEAEKALLEVLNYLEVRLPGVGFTDPFFLVLTNAVPHKDKMSYHIHARSFTHLHGQQLLNSSATTTTTAAAAQRKPAKPSKKTKTALAKRKKANARSKRLNSADDAEGEATAAAAEEEQEEEDLYDDLSDMVDVVDGKKSSSAAGVTKVIAFQDYRTVKLIADEVNQNLGRDLVDCTCYRPSGMLRCAFSGKLPSAQDHNFAVQQMESSSTMARKRLVPLITAADPALQQRLSAMEAVLRTMTDPEIMELSFCTRHLDTDAKVIRATHQHAKDLAAEEPPLFPAAAATAALSATSKHRFKLIRNKNILGPQATQAVEYDAYGNAVSPFLSEGAKWRRYRAVTAKLRTLHPRAAESYDVWVRVGLALHNFSNEDHVFEEWVLFSLKSPLKYSREVCRRKWLQFERNPDALNWRRGYNYLNSTVWRQVS